MAPNTLPSNPGLAPPFPSPYTHRTTSAWLVCATCGLQYPTADRAALTACYVCDDPRQFTPPGGQAFTTLGEMGAAAGAGGQGGGGSGGGGGGGGGEGNAAAATPPPKYRNVLRPLASDPRLVSVVTEPKFAIGQRAILVRTNLDVSSQQQQQQQQRTTNVLWDCLTYIDDATVSAIDALGGVAAIVISHPHYYSAHALWAAAFGCPVYLAAEDRGWVSYEVGPSSGGGAVQGGGGEKRRAGGDGAGQNWLVEVETEILAGNGGGDGEGGRWDDTSVRAVKLGGHFPGSLVLLFAGRLLIADTLVTTPSGLGSWGAADNDAGGSAARMGRPEGMNTFAFMWSIPNMIPLSADELARMWGTLRRYEFRSTHGAFVGTDVEDEGGVKGRVLRSMQIQARFMGWEQHAIMSETV